MAQYSPASGISVGELASRSTEILFSSLLTIQIPCACLRCACVLGLTTSHLIGDEGGIL